MLWWGFCLVVKFTYCKCLFEVIPTKNNFAIQGFLNSQNVKLLLIKIKVSLFVSKRNLFWFAVFYCFCTKTWPKLSIRCPDFGIVILAGTGKSDFSFDFQESFLILIEALKLMYSIKKSEFFIKFFRIVKPSHTQKFLYKYFFLFVIS